MPKNCAALDLSRRLRIGGSHHEFLPLALSIAITLTTAAAYAGGENFDAARPGTLPEDWTCGVRRWLADMESRSRHVGAEQAECLKAIG